MMCQFTVARKSRPASAVTGFATASPWSHNRRAGVLLAMIRPEPFLPTNRYGPNAQEVKP